MATLLITLPDAGDVVHEIAETGVRIGRSSDNDIRIEDASIAAHHAVFIPEGKFHRLQNLDEAQRTWVNGQMPTAAALTTRCLIRLGQVECLYFPEERKPGLIGAPKNLAAAMAESAAALERCHDLARDLEQEREQHRQTHAELLELSRQMQTNERALHEARTRAEESQREQLRAANEKLTSEVAAAHHEMELLTSRWNDLVAKLQRVHEAEAQVNHLIGGGHAYSSWIGRTAQEISVPPDPIPPHVPPQIVMEFDLPPDPEASVAASLQAMQEASDRLNANALDHEALHGSFGHARALSQHADAVGSIGAVRRLASALEALLGDLCKVPEQLDAQKLRSMRDALETLQLLAARDQFSAARDSFRAKICVISDDAEEPMIAALRLVDLDLSTFNYPTARLDAAGAEECDLIILDPGSPEPGSADHCSRLRQFPMHQKTPIIVLIPVPDAHEHLLPSSLSGHEDFIDKPFNVFEMSVKILGGIFRHRLAQHS